MITTPHIISVRNCYVIAFSFSRNFYPIMGIKKSAHRAVLRESRMLSTSQVLLVSIGSRYRGVVLNCPSILAFFIVVASSQISPHSVFECKITNLLAYKQIFKG